MKPKSSHTPTKLGLQLPTEPTDERVANRPTTIHSQAPLSHSIPNKAPTLVNVTPSRTVVRGISSLMDLMIGEPSKGNPAAKSGDHLTLTFQSDEVPAHLGEISVLTDDETDEEWLTAKICAESLGVVVHRHACNRQTLESFLQGLSRNSETSEPTQNRLLILAGRSPAWTYIDWLKSLVSQIQADWRQLGGGSGHSVYPYFPKILLVTGLQDSRALLNVDLAGIAMDFQVRPVTSAEMMVRIQRLWLGTQFEKQMTFSPAEGRAQSYSPSDRLSHTNPNSPTLAQPANGSPPVDTDGLRREMLESHPHQWGVYIFYPDRFGVSIRDSMVTLPIREFCVALLLFLNLGKPVSREVLLTSAFRMIGKEGSSSGRSLDVIMSKIRAKLDLTPANGYVLRPVYRVGYLLAPV